MASMVVFYICVDLSSLCARVLVYLSLGLDWILLSSLETVKGLQHGINTSGPVPQNLSWVSLFINRINSIKQSQSYFDSEEQEESCPDAFHGRLLRDAGVDTPLLLMPDDGHSDHSKRGENFK